jgi:hypothetical protein
MSFLNDTGVIGMEATESDFFVANGVYPAIISDSKIAEFNGANKWQITYKVHHEVENFGGKTVSEWFDLSPDIADKYKQWLVRRLASLSISREEQLTLEPADVIGTEVTITVKNKPSADGTRTFTNITKVDLGASEGREARGFADAF